MRALSWAFRLVVFVLLLGLAIKNSDVVTIRFFLGTSWAAPLSLILVIVFACGAVFGVTAGIITVLGWRRRRERIDRAKSLVESAQ